MLRDNIPNFIFVKLFGNRKFFGKIAPVNDKDWLRWLNQYPEIYYKTQRSNSLFSYINNAGYLNIPSYELNGKTVAEVGPGGCYHLKFFNGKPAKYIAFDISNIFLEEAFNHCQKEGIEIETLKILPNTSELSLNDCSCDFFLSYYSLEHIVNFEKWLDEIFRVLKPGGKLIGAIPVEGGMAWGLGRYLTSRRVLKRQYGYDIEKIICWEHPNFADTIIKALSKKGKLNYEKWPFKYMPLDANLIIRFEVTKT